MDNKIYDVVILGGGPAGLAAGLYAGRSRLSVLILEKGIDGGQIAVTHDIENYPGQSKVDGMTGQELVAPMTEQCKKFGCERVSDTITACDFSGPVKKFVGSKGEYLGKTVIVCTGAMTRSIGCKNEAKYVGKGISYCAVCDANFFEDFEIYVVGGNGIAAEVHVCRRLHQQAAYFPQHRLAAVGLKLHLVQFYAAALFRQFLHRQKAGIVAGVFVFQPRVSQTGNNPAQLAVHSAGGT